MTDLVAHPGPALPDPHVAVACRATPLSFELAAGDVLLPAMADHLARAGADSAVLAIRDAPLRQLDYVGPDWPDPEGIRAAWYSETRHMRAPARLIDITIMFGWKDGAPFLHGHGTWKADGKPEEFGHVMPDACIFDAPVRVEGWRLDGARFEVRPCSETLFSVFHPVDTGVLTDTGHAPNGCLVKLSPNADFETELSRACATAGFPSARAIGIGSLTGAAFCDGRSLKSRASEAQIRDGRVTAGGTGGALDIRITGVERQIVDGVLASRNPVLITAEVLLLFDDAEIAKTA